MTQLNKFATNNALYKDASSSMQRFSFDGLDIVFDPSWKNVGINISGGLDSALLTFLLGRIVTDLGIDCTFHFITLQRDWKTKPWAPIVLDNVIVRLQEMYPNIRYKKHSTYVPPETEDNTSAERVGFRLILASYNKFVFYTHGLDAIFNSTNRNPDVSIDGQIVRRNIKEKDYTLSDLIVKNKDNLVMLPFRYVQKDWIIQQYFNHDILDLYNATRSCEVYIGHHTLKNVITRKEDYTPGMEIPECGECFWCQEKTWGHSKVVTPL